MTPTQIESTYPPEVVAAWHWVKTYAPHRAKLNSDQQTYDGLTEDMAQQLDAALSKRAGYETSDVRTNLDSLL